MKTKSIIKLAQKVDNSNYNSIVDFRATIEKRFAYYLKNKYLKFSNLYLFNFNIILDINKLTIELVSSIKDNHKVCLIYKRKRLFDKGVMSDEYVLFLYLPKNSNPINSSHLYSSRIHLASLLIHKQLKIAPKVINMLISYFDMVRAYEAEQESKAIKNVTIKIDK